MIVQIEKYNTKVNVESKINLITKNKAQLPSIIDGWRFNFSKHSKERNYETYALTTLNTPDIYEGCLILNTKNSYQVYMAYIEVAPHNKGHSKEYDKVAGCLIAFACRLSFIKGKDGYLAFDVLEENDEDEKKLMKLYSKKYGAVRLEDSTTMIILPQVSEKLINRFLK